MRPIITLCTDFGVGDAEIGSLYGAIWSITPEARITDLTHGIERHNILQAALNLASYTPYFPAGSVHVVVVDPGVGTQRRPLAARIGEQYYVGPDNGVFTLVAQQAERAKAPVEIFHTDQARFWAAQVSPIFHGRDVFAPVAAHLAQGIPLQELGKPVTDPVMLYIPQAQAHGSGWRGEIVHIDHFGNLGTNISEEHIRNLGRVEVIVNGISVGELARTFGERQPGELVAILGGSGQLGIAIVNGSALKRLNAQLGWVVDVKPIEKKAEENTK